ncbi:MAG TPA: hypothetical protein PKD37_04390 [Oligoflexia bacterium]|nr:hypothetical protein [Oligoflexia bacterium]HMP27205.1 hypothetical protein [Oligoflexia bacterium]
MIKRFFVFLLLMTAFAACDDFVGGKGEKTDSNTGKPLKATTGYGQAVEKAKNIKQLGSERASSLEERADEITSD